MDTLSADDLEYFVASGRGTVYTFTVTNQNQAKGFAEACPYVMAYVDLEEGPRLLTNIVGCEPDEVTIGMAVVADFVSQERDDGEAFAVPVFVIATGGGAQLNLFVFTFLLAIFVAYTHRSNLRKLLAGEGSPDFRRHLFGRSERA